VPLTDAKDENAMKQMLIVVALVVGAAVLTWVIISGSDGDNQFDDKDAITTKSGLKYIDVKVGTGQEAEPGDTVLVHYTGTLTNGKKFDSSVDRGQPFEFHLGAGEVIKGWDEGVAGMKEGGKRKLVIPAKLAYGPQAKGSIPPNSVLLFDVELLKVK
jgi:FKBP-type peptidyl-prolyl cis-trans isomerase